MNASVKTRPVTSQEHWTQSNGRKLFMAEKRSVAGPPNGTILLVHGSSMGSQGFDLKIPGDEDASILESPTITLADGQEISEPDDIEPIASTVGFDAFIRGWVFGRRLSPDLGGGLEQLIADSAAGRTIKPLAYGTDRR